MSKAKHTAWKVKTNVHPETNGDPWEWVGRDVFGSGDAIPGVSITWTGAKGRDIARIIAASPEMYEVLTKINHTVSIHGKMDAGTELHTIISELIKKIEQ